jgi:hypothetical protein
MTEPCRWCGEMHLKGICPKIKAIEFEPGGETVKRVEFMTPRDCMPANGWPPFGQYAVPVAPLPPIGQSVQPFGLRWEYIGNGRD